MPSDVDTDDCDLTTCLKSTSPKSDHFIVQFTHATKSHVLKEQSNTDRHHPDICYRELVNLRGAIYPTLANSSSFAAIDRSIAPANSSEAARIRRSVSAISEHSATVAFPRTNQTSATLRVGYAGNLSRQNDSYNHDRLAIVTAPATGRTSRRADSVEKRDIDIHRDQPEERVGVLISDSSDKNIGDTITKDRIGTNLDSIRPTQYGQLDNPCQDILPKFVAQSSICWYVLGAGLSCYLMDLILRRLRRSKNPVELLDSRSDAEGNLIELTLSNNHKRFSLWMPGQFVYLNCPKIATYEWHPFTISSMDNRTRQFTLHIKTGGDWTRKLRDELKLRQEYGSSRQCSGNSSMSLFSRRNFYSIEHCYNLHLKRSSPHDKFDAPQIPTQSLRFARNYNQSSKVAKFDCPGQSFRSTMNHPTRQGLEKDSRQSQPAGAFKIDLDASNGENLNELCCCHSCSHINMNLAHSLKSQDRSIEPPCSKLDLYIDGPFHSPFERLLEQQVSVCIANGVGWTAFSSVFQQITNGYKMEFNSDRDDWWTKWSNFTATRPKKSNADSAIDFRCREVVSGRPSRLSTIESKVANEARLHLMIIVTTMEQFKPFYTIVTKYFKRIQTSLEQEDAVVYNPIREITAYITRCT